MNYQFEKNKLKSYLGASIYSSLKESKAIIAGGMITSLFTNKEINDVDVYFRNYDSLYNFAYKNLNGKFIVSHTKKATQYYHGDVLVQIIHYKTYQSAEDIFNDFDFTVCMGAFDFENEEFILHEDFLKHNSQRILKFNSNTSYPLISAIRTRKYEDKGYKISKAEHFRILMTCMTLNINSYEKLKEQLGGMYGENYDSLIEEVKDKEFDITEVIDRIANITLSEDYFTKFIRVDYDIDEILEELDKGKKFYIKLKSGDYRVIDNEVTKLVIKNYNDYEQLNVNDFYKDKKYYKFVQKRNDGLFSCYDKHFEYTVGELVSAKESYTPNFYTKKGVLFSNKFESIKKSPYHKSPNTVLIELEVYGEDVIKDTHIELTATKFKVIREVPESEWIEKLVEPSPF